MATTPVSAKIQEEAQQQAGQVLAEADQQVAQIQEQGRKESDGLDRQIQDDLNQAAQQEQHRIQAGARQAVTSQLLQAKHQIMADVFTSAAESLANMPAEQYRQLLSALLKKAVLTGKETVIPAEGEKHLNQELLDQVNQQLNETGNLKLAQDKVPGSGGFVLAEGKAQTQVTWEVLLGQARRQLEPELCKLLFAGAEKKTQ